MVECLPSGQEALCSVPQHLISREMYVYNLITQEMGAEVSAGV